MFLVCFCYGKNTNWSDRTGVFMNTVDNLKIKRIHKATMDIVYSEGFENLSLRQVAKLAKVSSGTPYVYYKDKQELLNTLCGICLDVVTEGFQEVIEKANSLEEKFYTYIFHIAEMFCHVPLMVQYISKFRKSFSYLPETLEEKYKKLDEPLLHLCEEAIQENLAKTSDIDLLQILLLSPLFHMFEHMEGAEEQFNPEIYEECARLSVEAVLKKSE